MAGAFDYSLAKHKQVVIVGRPGTEDTRALLRLVWQRYMPNLILMLADGGAASKNSRDSFRSSPVCE